MAFDGGHFSLLFALLRTMEAKSTVRRFPGWRAPGKFKLLEPRFIGETRNLICKVCAGIKEPEG